MMNVSFEVELANYLALRASLGLPTYQIGPLLKRLVQYLAQNCPDGTVRVSQVLDWVCAEPSYSTSTQHVRLSAARVFLKHLKTVVPETEIPGSNLIARNQRPEPFVFSDHQLRELLEIAGQIDSKKCITPLTLQTMFGLMACTGLRPGEAMRLKTSQVILDELAPRLLISRTKFNKTRFVPLHITTAEHLKTYGFSQSTKREFFFNSKEGKQINRITLHRIFQDVIAKTSIRVCKSKPHPTLHSLRHTFAVHRLLHWYDEGQDVRELLPNLSVYLGHSDPASSYWYVTCTPDLMTAAASRFEDYGSGRGGRQ